jgi:hypothetical protein
MDALDAHATSVQADINDFFSTLPEKSHHEKNESIVKSVHAPATIARVPGIPKLPFEDIMMR